MFRSILSLTLGIALLVSGCAPAPVQEPLPTNPPRTGDEWSVRMTQSGGIMGLMRSVEVLSDGSYTVVDERANKTVTGILAQGERARLQTILESAGYAASMPPGVCADCFIYDVEIQSDGNTFTAQVDDITLPDSGMEPLVEFLRELMAANLR